MFAYKVGSERLTLKEIEARAADNALSLGFLAESAVAHSYKQWCKQGDIVIDCGADGGWHTFGLCATVKPTGHVYSFEALPEEVASLIKQADEKRYREYLTFHQVALGNSTGTATFTRIRLGGVTGYSALKPIWMHPGADVEEFPVELATIDRLIRPEHKSRITYIKLDLEGGEFDALNGGSEVISQSRPLIVSECGGHYSAKTYGFTEDDFFDFFHSRNYSLFDFFGQPYTHEAFNAETMLAEMVAVPNEKVRTNIHRKVAEFMVRKLRRASATASISTTCQPVRWSGGERVFLQDRWREPFAGGDRETGCGKWNAPEYRRRRRG